MPLSSERFFLGALIYNHQIIKKNPNKQTKVTTMATADISMNRAKN